MSRLEISARAQDDLDSIYLFIARREQSHRPAEKWIQRLMGECAAIAASPGIGVRRDSLGPGLQSVSFGAYSVFYVFDAEKNVTSIVRVLHGARDIPQQFTIED